MLIFARSFAYEHCKYLKDKQENNKAIKDCNWFLSWFSHHFLHMLPIAARDIKNLSILGFQNSRNYLFPLESEQLVRKGSRLP